MDVADLQDYMQTAPVVHACQLNGGGGHGDKQLIVLEGGVGLVAKLAEGPIPTAYLQIRAECAAWILAQELGWSDLVPVTTFRVVQSIFTANYVAASVQLAWPLFKVAAEQQPPRTASTCLDAEVWRIAIFDALALNTDRNGTNWGFISEMPDQPKLIDHGHAFDAGAGGSLDFILERRGRPIPPELLDRLRSFFTRASSTELRQLLPPVTFDRVMDRTRDFVQGGLLNV